MQCRAASVVFPPRYLQSEMLWDFLQTVDLQFSSKVAPTVAELGHMDGNCAHGRPMISHVTDFGLPPSSPRITPSTPRPSPRMVLLWSYATAHAQCFAVISILALRLLRLMLSWTRRNCLASLITLQAIPGDAASIRYSDNHEHTVLAPIAPRRFVRCALRPLAVSSLTLLYHDKSAGPIPIVIGIGATVWVAVMDHAVLLLYSRMRIGLNNLHEP